MRAVSARALGAIVKGMGENCYNDLMPWLMETLASEVSSVDRSGAAQGIYLFIYLFFYLFILFIYLFIYLFNNLFKVYKFAKIQYTYIHKKSQTNWLIKVNYPILQKKKSSDLSDKNKRKRYVRHRRQGQLLVSIP